MPTLSAAWVNRPGPCLRGVYGLRGERRRQGVVRTWCDQLVLERRGLMGVPAGGVALTPDLGFDTPQRFPGEIIAQLRPEDGYE